METRPTQSQQVLIDTIRKLVRRGAIPNLQRVLEKSRPADIASTFHHLNEWETRALFQSLMQTDEALAAQVLSECDATNVSFLLGEMPVEEVVRILTLLPADDRADLMGYLPEELAGRILERMGGEVATKVEDLLVYDPETAGGLMTTDVFTLSEDLTAGEAIQKIQGTLQAEMVFYLYCVNENHQLTGVVSLRQLLTVPAATRLKDVMIEEVIRVPTTMDQEEVARCVSRYNLLAVPVVDDYNRLLGIVTVDDVIDVLREEATEDMLKMAGAAEDDIVSRSVLRSVFARLPWLAASFGGGLLASEVIGRYEGILQTVGILAGFIPVITGMGGNVGTQASTLVVRGLATGKLDPHNIAWYLLKEIRVGLIMGVTYGLFLGLFTHLRYGHGGELGLIVGGSICLSMFLAAVWGSLVPVVLSRLSIDPAVATGPFVTTSLDIMGITIYFTIATRLLDLA